MDKTYYESCSIPKPTTTKKKKKQNGYKDKPNRYCYYHKTSSHAERHEVYGGNPNRQISIDHGFQVDVCRACHRELEANITEWAQQENQYWQEYWQREYESRLIDAGISKKQARDLWMTLIGENFLEILEDD